MAEGESASSVAPSQPLPAFSTTKLIMEAGEHKATIVSRLTYLNKLFIYFFNDLATVRVKV